MSFDPTGYTLAHEHLHIDLSGFKNNVDCRLDQYAFICQEMNDLMTRGVRNVIEMTNRYMGRNAQFMLDVMRETGINVVACTGYYQDAFFPEHVATRSVQELAQEMVDEIEQGIDGTELKAGIIAEIGTSEGKITPLEEKVFIAAALAHNQTGRPISTHTSFSTMGLEQLALLQAHGVDLSRVTVGHCDLKDNLDNILKMIDLGAYVQFDTIGKNSYYPDEKRIAMLHALRDRGLPSVWNRCWLMHFTHRLRRWCRARGLARFAPGWRLCSNRGSVFWCMTRLFTRRHGLLLSRWG
ncbi:Phosphotriesterase homology protein [Escherichia coli]|nr:Phosphotriesterase homology protein [Escherichia coli]